VCVCVCVCVTGLSEMFRSDGVSVKMVRSSQCPCQRSRIFPRPVMLLMNTHTLSHTHTHALTHTPTHTLLRTQACACQHVQNRKRNSRVPQQW